MENRNAFFQVFGDDSSTYVKVFPALGEGKSLDSEVIQSYFFRHEIVNTNHKLFDDMVAAKEEKTFKVSGHKFQQIDEEMYVEISSSYMFVSATFFPPSDRGESLTLDTMLEVLSKKGIKYGINKELLKELSVEREYLKDYVVVEGREPSTGTVGKIEYMFSVEKNLQPKLNDDGTVDFRSLDNINNVKEGQLLAQLTPSVDGEDGMSVLGKPIKGKSVAKVKLSAGKDIKVSEDGCMAYACADGHVFLQGDVITLSKVYEVKKDVDVLTGDIEFNGDIHIKGSIRAGSSVHAVGDITVDGVIEGAIVRAEGNIIVKHGIKGMNKGFIFAKGDIVAKFMENVDVFAGGTIHSDSILYSNVTSLGSINVADKKGFIVGGLVRSANSIICRTAGSDMETATVLQLGTNPQCMQEISKTDEEIEQLKEEQKKCQLVIKTLKSKVDDNKKALSQKDVRTLKGLIVKNKKIKEKICKIQVYSEGLRSYTSIEKDEIKGISVEGRANIGVKVDICGTVFFVRKARFNTLFEREDHEIVVSNAR